MIPPLGWSTFVSVLPCYDGGCPVTQPGGPEARRALEVNYATTEACDRSLGMVKKRVTISFYGLNAG